MTPHTPPTSVRVHLFDDLFSRSNPRHREVVTGTAGESVAAVVRRAYELDPAKLVVIRNGKPVLPPALDVELVHPGDELHLAPRPGDPIDAVLIAIAIVSAVTSAYLISRVRQPTAASSSTPEEQRFGFNRFSNDAYAGDVIPVVFGRRPRYGGKVIARVPKESEDGSGAEKLKVLICLGHGKINKIGNQTADFDALPSSVLPGIYLNDQPVSSFPGAIVSGRMGTAAQATVPGFNDVETLRDVGVGGTDLRNTSGADRVAADPSGEAVSFTTLAAVHAFVARIRLPDGLFKVDNEAQLEPRSVRYRIRWRVVAGAWGPWATYTVRQANQSPFWSSPRISVGATPQTVEIQTERITAEPSDATVKDKVRWDSVVEILDTENNYPGSALLMLELTAGEQLQDVPRVSVDAEGYAELRRWDGLSPPSAPVFTVGYSANPADIALALITNTKWGMGALYGDSKIDFASLFAWRTRCAEQLERTGQPGVFRDRYRFNFALDAHRDGADWLRAVCRAGRCVPVTVGGVWRFVADKPQAVPVEVFTDGSIATDDRGVARFVYRREFALLGATRPNRIVAQFENENREGKSETLGYPPLPGTPGQDPLWLATETPREENVRVEGITDPDQVAAEIIYLMNRTRYLTRTVRFTTTKPVVIVQPGERFDLAMSLPVYGVGSGRVLAGSTTTSIKLDRSLTFELGKVYRLKIIHLDNSIEFKTIANAPGAYARGAAITVASAFVQFPGEGAEWAVEIPAENKVLKPFICTRVAPLDTEELLWEIEGIEYVEGVHSDTPGALNLPNYSGLAGPLTPPGPVVTLRAFERTDPVTGARQAHLAWGQTPGDAAITATFRIFRRSIGTQTWVAVPNPTVSTRGAIVELVQLDRGYEFVVCAVSVGGAYLSPYDPRHPLAVLVLGLSAPPPPAPTGLAITRQTGNVYNLTWNAVADATGYIVYSGGVNANTKVFQHCLDSFVLARTETNALDGLRLPRFPSIYFYVRSIGRNGRLSANVAFATVTNTFNPAGRNLKSSHVVSFASGTWTNQANSGGVYYPSNRNAPAVWVSPVLDSLTLNLTQVAFALRSINRATTPNIVDVAFTVPSIEADQWGIDDLLGGTRRVGMIFPPYPDNSVEWKVEISYDPGSGVYTDYERINPFALYSAMFRFFRIRLTMTATREPYLPAVQGLSISTFA